MRFNLLITSIWQQRSLYWCNRKSRAACAQSFAPRQQATIEILLAITLTIACSRYIYYGVILHAHPVRDESHKVTPPERLQQYNLLEVPLWANSVVTLLVNSRGWSSLRVVFSLTRNFTVIVTDFLRCFGGQIRVPRIENLVPGVSKNYHRVPKIRENRVARIREIGSLQVHTGYLIFSLKKPAVLKIFSPLPEKQFVVKFSTVLNLFFTIQDLRNLRLPWKTEFALKIFTVLSILLHSGVLSNVPLPWKTECALTFFTVLNIFIMQDFWATCACPEYRVALKIFTVLNIFFYHSGFEQLALALKNRVALKFYTVLNYFLLFRIWAACACPENLDRGGGRPHPQSPASYAYGSTKFLFDFLFSVNLHSTLLKLCKLILPNVHFSGLHHGLILRTSLQRKTVTAICCAIGHTEMCYTCPQLDSHLRYINIECIC